MDTTSAVAALTAAGIFAAGSSATTRRLSPIANGVASGPSTMGGYKVSSNGSGCFGLADVEKFVGSLASSGSFDSTGGEIFVARAPGRLDVMGGIADYSGSLVLQMPIAEACLVALQLNSSGKYTVKSDATGEKFTLPVAELNAVASYDAAKALFQGKKGGDWAAYILGCFVVLRMECGARFDAKTDGCTFLVHSDVPISMGVSSSASVEVSSMQAIACCFGIDLSSFKTPGKEYSRGTKLAMLCQKVENLVVGAPCGIMDQMASALGQEGKLLALLCRPAEVQGLVEIPSGIEVWGIDSGHKHAVGGHSEEGADYGSVRVGAFMGKKIWNETLAKQPGRKAVEYLTDLAPSDFIWSETGAPHKAPLIGQLKGKAFTLAYGSHDDAVTTIEPERTYTIFTPSQHPVDEHSRVTTFAQLLQSEAAATPVTLATLGELMRGSHLSYTRCGLGSTSTDTLVKLVAEAGTDSGLYGAKITGGGSGGSVCVIAEAGKGKAAVEAVCAKYQKITGHKPHIFAGSSIGADAFGCLTLRKK